MKKIFGLLLALTIFTSCRYGADEQKATLPAAKTGEQMATFAGGCFWGMQEGFLELKGVVKSTSGYSGGSKENPTYQEVVSGTTGHAEAVQVIYDPSVISFAQLLDVFFVMHDPTQLNRQGPDVGESYRSVAFYGNPEEKKAIDQAILKYEKSGLHSVSIVTDVQAFKIFYPAEKYHQDYYKQNPNSSYIINVCGPKVEKLRKAFPQLIKDEYK